MIGQLFDEDVFKILTVFGLAPGMKLRRQELKQKTLMNNVPLDKALSKLVSAGILLKEQKLYAVNLENAKPVLNIISQQYKNIRELPLNVYFLLLDAVGQFSTMKNIELWLFGSYAKLVYKISSDIDLAILAPKTFSKERANKIVRKLEEKYGLSVEAHIFGKSKFYKSKRDPLVKEILRAGIRLI